ncbi:predicted protein [Uncinocarpus reesii 1704]|uniref:Peroxin 20 n=1 Tax=Uncinocarpus reesii (strain UAMH 1704) TaxID=336963 RepID=C4JT53_UNCRE|nr:uncharacterized protein UREG_05642 [Uncinocarpus reesii 1704]EEP80800.1 predicted protein [Uncinocarpus reesii 1704]
MADALCGPSNPLQNFQKHAATDRTLQQDRILSRHSPAQGFRSHSPNEGVLDSEFQSFEAGFSGPALSDAHNPPVFQQAGSHLSPGNYTGASSGWAPDFQNLHISPPSASTVQHRLQAQAPTHGPVSSGWHNEFMNHSQSIQPSSMPQKQMMHSPLMNRQFQPMSNFSSQMDSSQMLQPQNSQATEVFDESAFEAAFAEARAEVESQESKLQQVDDEPMDNVAPPLETIRIGSDTILATQEGVDEAEELAKTAGQLLESVSHDQSQKFKESNFLALMRQLRDREVTVEGDEFRQAVQPLHPGGPYYPEQRKLSHKFDVEDKQTTLFHHDDPILIIQGQVLRTSATPPKLTACPTSHAEDLTAHGSQTLSITELAIPYLVSPSAV